MKAEFARFNLVSMLSVGYQ